MVDETTAPVEQQLARWRDNLKITQGDPVCGDPLHGPALDFVIEQIDGILARAEQPRPTEAGNYDYWIGPRPTEAPTSLQKAQASPGKADAGLAEKLIRLCAMARTFDTEDHDNATLFRRRARSQGRGEK